MSDTDGFVLLLFLAQPFIFALYVGKAYQRNEVVWGLIGLSMNVGIIIFFESHLKARSLFDIFAECTTVAAITSGSILVILEILRNGPRAGDGRPWITRGVFRTWVVISAGWILFCSFEFASSSLYCNDCSFFPRVVLGAGFRDPNYFDIGNAFVGFPAVAFAIGLAFCWIIDGFRRPPQTVSELSANSQRDPATLPAPALSDVAGQATAEAPGDRN